RRSRTSSERWGCTSGWMSAATTRPSRRRRRRPEVHMRHRKDHRKLSRTHQHRRALLRNLVTALFQYERIETTVAKAKETRRVAERLITFAKRGDVAARRHVTRFVTRDEVTSKLFGTIAPWYAERAGG